jgi:hypothetical protein
MPNQRLITLRGDLSQAQFAARFFRVSHRTYQRYEAMKWEKLPGPVRILAEIYEKKQHEKR